MEQGEKEFQLAVAKTQSLSDWDNSLLAIVCVVFVVGPLGSSRAHVKRYHIFSVVLCNLLAEKLFKMLSKQ
jgi:hypothetical protein